MTLQNEPINNNNQLKKYCRFKKNGIKYIDYKDLENLSKLLTQRGKIFSRKRSGNCAKCQRLAQKAIKRARYMGLLPYAN